VSTSFGISLEMAGDLIKLARRSGFLALNDAKKKNICQNPMNAALLIYTDCPCTAAWFSRLEDFENYLGVSQIVATACVIGEDFPEDSFEAKRPDPEMPRIAAMFFHVVGTKCPRCRKFTENTDHRDLCARCASVIDGLNE
jgi:hypothetical protein